MAILHQIQYTSSLVHNKKRTRNQYVQFSSVRYTAQHKVLRGCIGLLKDVAFQSTPKLFFGDERKVKLHELRDRDAKTLFFLAALASTILDVKYVGHLTTAGEPTNCLLILSLLPTHCRPAEYSWSILPTCDLTKTEADIFYVL